MTDGSCDVAIIGAGPAGLTAALALVRSRKNVALYDCWPPRNATATEVHGFVTQDGTPPQEMRRQAREELAGYPTFIAHENEPVHAIRGTRGSFAVETAIGTVRARRVVLCVGLVDELPDLPGYRELWGHSLFQCPNCHAWEVRDQTFGYLAPNAGCAGWALLLRSWTRELIVFTNGGFDVPTELATKLAQASVTVEPRRIAGLRAQGGKLCAVQLEDGTEIARQVLFVRPSQRQTPLVETLVASLGMSLAQRDQVAVDDRLETSVPGIYAAGDLMARQHGALIAAANGARAAHALDEELSSELVLARLR